MTEHGRPPAAGDGYSETTYHRMDLQSTAAPKGPRPPSVRPPGTGDLTITRAVIARVRYFIKLVAHKVVSFSQADGARESGLTALIWNQVMSYGSDAMITVALAGTVFFSAPRQDKAGNVLLYLLMTMAPFAVVAPFIGPALDRYQHGRRFVMALTAIGRALLAVVMAFNFNDVFVLFPAALGSLVLSKAYAVIRAAAAPRLLPRELTLVEANARLSMFGLASALIGGGIVGLAIKVSGSYFFGLMVSAVAFAATGFYALRLPRFVDSLPRAGTRSRAEQDQADDAENELLRPSGLRPSLFMRLRDWAGRGYAHSTVTALVGESSMRWLSGFLTLFLAFYVEATSHGWEGAASLGMMGAAAAVGNVAGTAVGTRLRAHHPDIVIVVSGIVAAVACVLAAMFFSLGAAILVLLVSAVANSLSKISLDSIIQRDVGELMRSSAFARSETFLQLAWVLGAGIAVLLPSKNGTLGLTTAAVMTTLLAVSVVLRNARGRSMRPSSDTGRSHGGNLHP